MTKRGGFSWLLALSAVLLAGVVYVVAVIPYQRNVQAMEAIERAGGEYELECRGCRTLKNSGFDVPR